MSSPEPVFAPTQVGNMMVSLGTPRPAGAAPIAPCPSAANEEIPPSPRHPGEVEPSARVPLSAWLSLAFWALGTALLFSLGVAYRLVA